MTATHDDGCARKVGLISIVENVDVDEGNEGEGSHRWVSTASESAQALRVDRDVV